MRIPAARAAAREMRDVRTRTALVAPIIGPRWGQVVQTAGRERRGFVLCVVGWRTAGRKQAWQTTQNATSARLLSQQKFASVPTRYLRSPADCRRAAASVRYDPRRPDFMDVAGGFVLRTGAAGTWGCCTLVASGTPCCCCGAFFFLEKSGISFFLFMIWRLVIEFKRCVSELQCERGDSNPHGLLHWILSPARLPIPPHSQHSKNSSFVARKEKAPADFRRGFLFRTVCFTARPAG
jgi:hypothetical protein